MILYVPTSGNDVADRLSQALWSLCRPPQIFKDQSKTREELIIMGLLASPALP